PDRAYRHGDVRGGRRDARAGVCRRGDPVRDGRSPLYLLRQPALGLAAPGASRGAVARGHPVAVSRLRRRRVLGDAMRTNCDVTLYCKTAGTETYARSVISRVMWEDRKAVNVVQS